MGVGVAVAAVALGASVIEKHFTLSRAEGGVDSAFSLEPQELSALVQDSERAWQSLGQVSMAQLRQKKRVGLPAFHMWLLILPKGSSPQNLRIVRPGHGAPPYLLDHLRGLLVVHIIEAPHSAWRICFEDHGLAKFASAAGW